MSQAPTLLVVPDPAFETSVRSMFSDVIAGIYASIENKVVVDDTTYTMRFSRLDNSMVQLANPIYGYDLNMVSEIVEDIVEDDVNAQLMSENVDIVVDRYLEAVDENVEKLIWEVSGIDPGYVLSMENEESTFFVFLSENPCGKVALFSTSSDITAEVVKSSLSVNLVDNVVRFRLFTAPIAIVFNNGSISATLYKDNSDISVERNHLYHIVKEYDRLVDQESDMALYPVILDEVIVYEDYSPAYVQVAVIVLSAFVSPESDVIAATGQTPPEQLLSWFEDQNFPVEGVSHTHLISISRGILNAYVSSLDD